MMTKKIFSQINSAKLDLIFFVNLSFCTFPLSLILGNLVSNLNFLIFILLGIFYLKNKPTDFKPDLFFKIIILFFVVVLLSTLIMNIKSLKLVGFENTNFNNLIKSIFFLRFLLFLIIVYLLNNLNVINFKYFFYSASCFSIIVLLDVIHQYIFGYNVLGFESSMPGKNSSFFGDELVAGAYLERFSFFAIFLIFYLASKKKWVNFFITSFAIYIFGLGILFSGNRMPLILFLFGLILILLFINKLRKQVICGLSIFVVTFVFLYSHDTQIKSNYLSFFQNSQNISIILSKKIQNNFKNEKTELNTFESTLKTFKETNPYQYGSGHLSLYLTSLDTWKLNKIFGNGIKSFRNDCSKVITTYTLCSNHPHNYYLEVLTDTGLVGFCFFVLIFLILLKSALIFLYGFKYKINKDNLIFTAALISILLELFPFRSSGSFFSSNSATYIALILSIVITYKRSLTV